MREVIMLVSTVDYWCPDCEVLPGAGCVIPGTRRRLRTYHPARESFAAKSQQPTDIGK